MYIVVCAADASKPPSAPVAAKADRKEKDRVSVSARSTPEPGQIKAESNGVAPAKAPKATAAAAKPNGAPGLLCLSPETLKP